MAKIRMKLNPESIENALKEVNKRIKSDGKSRFVEGLMDKGVEFAKAQVRELGAYYTGELEASITGYYSPILGTAVIKVNSPYAKFVEFGTGVVGKGSPHPFPEGWKYDINEHGEAGWWYFNDRDDKWHWTKGMASRPFMYNTYMELQRLAGNRAKVVFNGD